MDPDLHAAEDHDFFLRAALAGHVATPGPGAGYDYRPRTTAVRMIRQRAAWAYWRVVLWEKYYRFPFVFLPDRRQVRRSAYATFAALAAARRGDRRVALIEVLDAAALMAETAAAAFGRVELATGRRARPAAVEPVTPADALVGGGLPPGPCALIVGDTRLVAALASAIRIDPAVGAPPAGLLPSSDAEWLAAPPLPAELVAAGNRKGGGLPVRLATTRLAAAAPVTNGEAVLAYHAVHAWLGRKARWVAAAGGDAGAVAAARLRDVPIVAVGAAPVYREPAVTIDADELRADPTAAVLRIAPVLALTTPERVGAVLRLLLVTTWIRSAWSAVRR
jgi:hypothetical protein